jgi:HEPN domain-containing protein
MEQIIVPPSIIKDIISVEDFYIQSRYPDSRMRDFSEQEAKNALKIIERIINFLRTIR